LLALSHGLISENDVLKIFKTNKKRGLKRKKEKEIEKLDNSVLNISKDALLEDDNKKISRIKQKSSIKDIVKLAENSKKVIKKHRKRGTKSSEKSRDRKADRKMKNKERA